MKWTDDKIDILTRMWGGESSSEIALALGAGCTRNMVIGKAHRLHLPPCNRVEVQRRAATKRYRRIRQAAR